LKKEDLQSKSFPRSSKTNVHLDNLNSVKLKSKAELHPTACIALNVIEDLQRVERLQQQLKLTFDTPSNAQLIYTTWLSVISKTNYMNGGKEWGCINVTTLQPMVIMKRIVHKTMKLIQNQITVNDYKRENDMSYSNVRRQIYFPGQTISIAWSIKNIDASHSLTIKLKRVSFLKDDEPANFKVIAGQGSYQYIIPLTTNT
ncbi:unnamed protein product, partial [Didymodactylos carnosus]